MSYYIIHFLNEVKGICGSGTTRVMDRKIIFTNHHKILAIPLILHTRLVPRNDSSETVPKRSVCQKNRLFLQKGRNNHQTTHIEKITQLDSGFHMCTQIVSLVLRLPFKNILVKAIPIFIELEKISQLSQVVLFEDPVHENLLINKNHFPLNVLNLRKVHIININMTTVQIFSKQQAQKKGTIKIIRSIKNKHTIFLYVESYVNLRYEERNTARNACDDSSTLDGNGLPFGARMHSINSL